MSVLTPLERYVLDCTGCVVRRNVIPVAEITRAMSVIAAKVKGDTWKFPLLSLDDIFWNWAERDVLFQPAKEACGPYVRLDHAFGVQGGPGAPKNLHGGPNCNQFSCFYHDTRGQLGLTGQLVAGVTLIGQTPMSGGFSYVPGSHKAYNPVDGRDVADSLMGHESLIVPTLQPGDVVMFFEALVHGDTALRATDKRLVAYYKYVPGFSTWRDPGQQEPYRLQAIQLNKSARIKQLLSPPWAAQYDDADGVSCSMQNTKRSPTP